MQRQRWPPQAPPRRPDVYELKPAELGQARPLFRALDHHLAVNAILEGTVPGTIYVDDRAFPHAAFTGFKHRCFLVGSPENDAFNEALRLLLTGTLYPHLRAGPGMLALTVAPESWEDKLNLILDKRPIKVLRQFYLFEKLKHDWRALLPEGFRLRLIDAALLEERQLTDLTILEDELCSERASVHEFLDKSFGVAALHGDELAGWCTSEYNSGGRCGVGIGTLKPYRRRGLAAAMASALIEHALSRGVTHIGWHCFAGNEASAATALKAGFEKVCDYASYLAWFDEAEAPTANGKER